jgi:uncharacterized protein YlaN (UPF0358 family)
MKNKNIEILKTFDLNNIPDLDTVTLGALELFQEQVVPKMNLSTYKRPMVVGSGNAEATGRIIFEDVDAVFASESNYEHKLNTIENIDGVILISASGGKHAPIIAKKAKELGKPVTLITNTNDSPASLFVDGDNIFVFPKNREPYTYNTSTYMSMILGKSHEDASEIEKFIKENIDTMDMPDFSKYDKFYIIVPTQFTGIIRMLQVKFIELFGRKIARDVETSEYVKHATTVVPSDELFLSFGYENNTWGTVDNRLNVPLTKDAGYGAMMAVSYYVIGKIQKAHPQYFKENIEEYTKEVSKIFGSTISPIVE